ncbi:MAG: alanine/glycine:cation symporter family protein [Chitinophagales bacterium]
MRRIIYLITTLLLPQLMWAQDKSIDERINDIFQPITDVVVAIVFFPIAQLSGQDVPLVLLWLVAGAIFFTVYMKFTNIRFFRLAIDIVRGKYTDPDDKGEVSHFQALTAALSGTVGLGNIAGVAIAISVGGPGATFWMIVAGLLGMSTKMVECTMGVKYRQMDAKGKVYGGPMYYLSQGLAERGMGGLGKILSIFFAIMCIGGSFGGGNMFQVNQAFKQFSSTFGLLEGSGWVFGLLMAVLVAVVIIGGIKSIANVTEKIVPFMVGIYMAAAIVIIGMHIGELPSAIGKIFTLAFSNEAVAGGFIGVLIQGFRRAAFSNEAGVGSASIAHAAVKTNNPASEGLVALLEPFIDTVVVCTMTALVIIITDNYHDSTAADGVALTSNAFAGVISWFPFVLSIAVILFAFSTMITWSYYGLQAWTYLFGRSQTADITYKVLFCVFVVVGSAATLGAVTDFSDMMIFAMCFPNIFGLFIMRKTVKKEIEDYIANIKSGVVKRHD